MKTTRLNYPDKHITNYKVTIVNSEILAPIMYTINHAPFSLQDYMTVAQARHLANDLNAMADIAERMENE